MATMLKTTLLVFAVLLLRETVRAKSIGTFYSFTNTAS